MARIRPDLAEFERLSGDGQVVPVSRELLADTLTPVLAFTNVGEAEGSYLLESVVGGEKWARYSFVGFDPDRIVRGAGDRYEEWRAGGWTSRTVTDPWEALRAALAGYRPVHAPWMPRFWGGAVGYVSYDAVRRFEPSVGERHPPEPESYDFCFAIGGSLLVFDNLRQTVRVVALARREPGESAKAVYDAALERIDRTVARLRSPVSLRALEPPDPTEAPAIPPSSFDHASFCAAVETCKEHIRAGDIFQVVLSQRFRVPVEGVDCFDVYRMMRAVNPSPYMYFLRFGHARIAGASPETLVRVEDGMAEVRPIAGTRPRGETVEQDLAIEREMLADPKEIAEHVMLVDLGRNDLGRISEPGTVELTERMVTERYSHVMHITSNVRGRLSKGRDAIDVLRATFPAGTLSGAPKVRAMQIIDALEPERRGIYGGAVGYIGFEGTLDMAIAIRTVVEQDGEFRVQAGAGIVEASRPEAEYQETVNKARAALLSVAAARPGRGG